jgi:FtsZ-interacting cell division protein ZipA
MRPRLIISIVVIIAVIVGGFLWFNYQAEQTRVIEQAAQAERDQADRALEEEAALEAERVRAEELAIEAELEAERAREDQVAIQAEKPEVVITEQAVPEAAASDTVPAEGVVAADEGLTVVGDEITEEAIVVESTGDAVILEAEESEPPRVYRRAFGLNIRLLFHWHSRFHRTSPLLHAA